MGKSPTMADPITLSPRVLRVRVRRSDLAATVATHGDKHRPRLAAPTTERAIEKTKSRPPRPKPPIKTLALDSPERDLLLRAFTCWRDGVLGARLRWRLLIKANVRSVYVARVRILRAWRSALQRRRDAQFAADYARITLTKRLFNTWEVRAAAASSLRTALERAADWRLGTVVSATFYQWLVALRLRQRATTMNAIADAFLARHVIRHCLAHWMSAALEVQQLRPALEWATTEAQGQFAAAVVEAWRVRCQVAASDRVLLQEHADRSMHRLALTSVQRWYQRLDECRSMAAAADAFYLPRERERLLLAALDTWRAAAAAQQQSHTMAPAADAFRQSHLVRPVLLRLVSKAERAIADRARADAFHLALQWRRVRRRFVRPAKAAALALWRTATARRLASKRVMASAVTLYRRTIQQRALDAWREYVTIRRAHSAQMQAAALVATRALVTAVLARWDAAVHESRHARIVDRRVVAWRAEFAKARAWYAWIGVVRRQQARRHQVQLAVQWHQTRMSLAVLATWQHAAARRRWEHEWVAHFVQVRQHQCATVALLQWRRQTLARVTERRAVKHIATVRQRLALCRAWNLWVEFCALQRTFRRREALAAEEWKSKVIRRVVICIKRDIAQRKVGQEVNHWRLQRQAISTWIGAFERRQQEHDRVQVLYTELARRSLERHLFAWLLVAKQSLLKSLRRDQAVRFHMQHSGLRVLLTWRAKCTIKQLHWSHEQKAAAVYNFKLQVYALKQWRNARPDWTAVHEMAVVRPREFADGSTLRRAWVAWRQFLGQRRIALWRVRFAEKWNHQQQQQQGPSSSVSDGPNVVATGTIVPTQQLDRHDSFQADPTKMNDRDKPIPTHSLRPAPRRWGGGDLDGL